MTLEPGDVWTGLDTLRVIDDATGEVLTEGCLITGMDIDPDENLITMSVSSDIG